MKEEKQNNIENEYIDQIPDTLEHVETQSRFKLINSAISKYKSGKFLTLMNMSNTVIGGGILTLPSSMNYSGLGLGLFLIILSALINDYTINLLVHSSFLLKKYIYQDIVKDVLGKGCYYIIILCQFFYTISVSMTFSIIITDNFVSVTSFYISNVPLMMNRPFVLFLLTISILLPLSLFKNVSFLDKFSLLSILFVSIYSVFVIYAETYLSEIIFLPEETYEFAFSDFLRTISALAFAYTAHHNVCPIFKGCKEMGIKNFSYIVHGAIGTVTFINVTIATACYITFSSLLYGNFFNYYCSDNHFANVSRFLFIITITTTYPFQIFAARDVIISMFKRFAITRSWFHYLVTVILVAVCYMVPAFYSDIQTVVEITGSLVAAPLAFIFPPLVYLKLTRQSFLPKDAHSIFLYLIVCYGLFVTIFGTYFSIKNIVKGESHSIVKYWCDYFLLRNV